MKTKTPPVEPLTDVGRGDSCISGRKYQMTQSKLGASPTTSLNKRGSRWLKIKQISEMTGLPGTTLHDWKNRGYFKYRKVGRSVLIRSDWWAQFEDRLDYADIT